MTIEATLSNIEKLLGVIAANTAKADATTAPAQPAPSAAKSKAAAKVKAAPAEKPAAEKTEDANDDFLNDEPAAPAKELTKDDVRAALVSYQKATTQENARKLLGKFGAETLGALATAKYGEIIAEAQKLAAAKAAP